MTDAQRKAINAAWMELQSAAMRLSNLGEIEDPELAATIEAACSEVENAMGTLWNV